MKRFQAAHNTAKALESLPAPEQNEILKSTATQIKEAALSAAERCKNLPAHVQSA